MANDRLFLKCTSCGEMMLLAKWWGSRYETASPTGGPNLEDFLNDHWICAGNAVRPPADQFKVIDERDLAP